MLVIKMLPTAKIRYFIIPLLICAVEGRKAPSPVNVSEVHLESVVAEVCFSSPSWLDGPGTESALLMEMEAEEVEMEGEVGKSRCTTRLLTGQQWRPGALLAFEGRWGNPVTRVSMAGRQI